MNLARKTAIIVGVLFIFATVLSLISSSLIGAVVNAPDYLVSVSANQNQVIAGVLVLLATAASVFLIPAVMFPILKQYNEGIALGYFGFRIFEAITFIVDAICSLLLVTLSQEYVNAGAPVASYFQTTGALLLGARNWVFPLNPIVFGGGALLFYYVLYQSKLIPRWLSAWGLIGAALVLATGVLGIFGNFLTVLALPIAVQEMVMAGWLIIKGFNSLAIAPASQKQI